MWIERINFGQLTPKAFYTIFVLWNDENIVNCAYFCDYTIWNIVELIIEDNFD